MSEPLSVRRAFDLAGLVSRALRARGTAPPERPGVGAIAVVCRDNRFLLAQRSRGGYIGKWGFPGGHIERGETAVQAAMRELAEESGIAADPIGVLTAIDEIGRGPDGGVKWHYVLIAVLARWRAGDGIAADDAAALCWATLDEIERQAVPVLPQVAPLARLAQARLAQSGTPGP